MYGNNYGYYNPTRNIGVPMQPINNQFMQQPIQPIQQPVQQYLSNGIQNGLQGKVVDNIDVVKATDIPLDGSTSYFVLTDGSAIVTKKLGANGTSEIQVYKPVVEEKQEEQVISVNTINDEVIKKLDKLDNSDILDSLLEEIKDLKQDIKDLKSKPKDKEK